MYLILFPPILGCRHLDPRLSLPKWIFVRRKFTLRETWIPHCKMPLLRCCLMGGMVFLSSILLIGLYSCFSPKKCFPSKVLFRMLPEVIALSPPPPKKKKQKEKSEKKRKPVLRLRLFQGKYLPWKCFPIFQCLVHLHHKKWDSCTIFFIVNRKRAYFSKKCFMLLKTVKHFPKQNIFLENILRHERVFLKQMEPKLLKLQKCFMPVV